MLRFPLYDSFDAITGKEIRNLEAEFGMSLPEEYVQFLLLNNGGFFDGKDCICWAVQGSNEPEGTVDGFYAICDDRTWSLRETRFAIIAFA